MCPVLSLANRAFLALALLACLPVQAEELKFDVTGAANNRLPISASFTLDTSSGSTSVYFLGAADNILSSRINASDEQEAVTRNASFSNFNVLVNGQSVVAAPSLTGAYNFSTNSSPQGCPGAFCRPFLGYGSLSIFIDPQSFFFWQNIPTNSELPSEQFNSTGLQPSQAYLFQNGVMTQRWDAYAVTVTDLGPSPHTSVPEPPTWILLLLGFAGVVLCGRKRIRVRAPALSA
jgi:hypothetical protein